MISRRKTVVNSDLDELRDDVGTREERKLDLRASALHDLITRSQSCYRHS
jgi:hypothetical protein